MENNNKIEVTFTHPEGNNVFTAAITPQCTGARAVQGLLRGNENGPFLSPLPAGQDYVLTRKRDGHVITPNTTFEEAGVENGEVIEVQRPLRGA